MKISGLSILCEVVRSPLKKFPLVAEIRNNTTDTELATTNTDMATAVLVPVSAVYFEKKVGNPPFVASDSFFCIHKREKSGIKFV